MISKKYFLITFVFFLLVEPVYSRDQNKFAINQNANHDSIRTVFVIPSDGIKPSQIARWEARLIENGYNVIDRSKIEKIIKEQSQQVSGLIENNIEIGKIAGADAILNLDETMDNTYDLAVKLISISTGEILFVATCYYNPSKYTSEQRKEVQDSILIWMESIFDKYKKAVCEISQ